MRWMGEQNGDRRVVMLLVAVGLLIRLAWQVYVGFYVEPERWEYDEIARNLSGGRGYVFDFLGTEWHTFGTPLYPLVLAVLHVLSGGPESYLLIGPFQAAVSAALAVLAYAIGHRLSPGSAGLVAALVVTFHPGLVIYSAKVHELTFEAALLAVGLVTLIDLDSLRSPSAGVRAGLSLGLAALTRPTYAAFSGVALFWFARRRPRRTLALAGIWLVLLATPWTLRNVLVLGGGGPSAPYNCVTLWMGNSGLTDGGTVTADGRSVFEVMPESLREGVVGRPEASQGRVFCETAIGSLLGDPIASFARWGQKLFYFWWFHPQAGIFYPPGWLGAYQLLYLGQLALIALGIVSVWRGPSRRALMVVLLQLAVISIAQSFFYVEGRHRLAIEPSLAALAAAGAVTMRRPLQRTLRAARMCRQAC